MAVELRVTKDQVAIWSLGREPECLATHPRADRRGRWVVDPRHWDGLPAGQAPLSACSTDPDDVVASGDELEPEWARIPGADTSVATRALST